jgi:hypothetical protein
MKGFFHIFISFVVLRWVIFPLFPASSSHSLTTLWWPIRAIVKAQISGWSSGLLFLVVRGIKATPISTYNCEIFGTVSGPRLQPPARSLPGNGPVRVTLFFCKLLINLKHIFVVVCLTAPHQVEGVEAAPVPTHVTAHPVSPSRFVCLQAWCRAHDKFLHQSVNTFTDAFSRWEATQQNVGITKLPISDPSAPSWQGSQLGLADQHARLREAGEGSSLLVADGQPHKWSLKDQSGLHAGRWCTSVDGSSGSPPSSSDTRTPPWQLLLQT